MKNLLFHWIADYFIKNIFDNVISNMNHINYHNEYGDVIKSGVTYSRLRIYQNGIYHLYASVTILNIHNDIANIEYQNGLQFNPSNSDLVEIIESGVITINLQNVVDII